MSDTDPLKSLRKRLPVANIPAIGRVKNKFDSYSETDSRLLYLIQIVGCFATYPLAGVQLFCAYIIYVTLTSGSVPVNILTTLFNTSPPSIVYVAVVAIITVLGGGFVLLAVFAPFYWIDRSPINDLDQNEKQILGMLSVGFAVAYVLSLFLSGFPLLLTVSIAGAIGIVLISDLVLRSVQMVKLKANQLRGNGEP
jgi:hypothetical protein